VHDAVNEDRIKKIGMLHTFVGFHDDPDLAADATINQLCVTSAEPHFPFTGANIPSGRSCDVAILLDGLVELLETNGEKVLLDDLVAELLGGWLWRTVDVVRASWRVTVRGLVVGSG